MNVDSLFLNLNILSRSKIKTTVERPKFLRTAITTSAQFLKIPFVGWPNSDSHFPLHLLIWALVIFLPVMLLSSLYLPQKQGLEGVGSEAGSLLTCYDTCRTDLCSPQLVAQRRWGCEKGSLAGSTEIWFPWAWIRCLGDICPKEWLLTDRILLAPVEKQ